MNAAKKGFYSVSIASASSCLTQLFRVIRSLTSLTERNQNTFRNSAISTEAFVCFLGDKVLSLHCNLPANVDTISELVAPWLSLDLLLDSFNLLSFADIGRILSALRLLLLLFGCSIAVNFQIA